MYHFKRSLLGWIS